LIIEVFQDTVCPWCRIGKRHLQTALERWDGEPVELEWRAYVLDPGVPAQGAPYRELMSAKLGGEERMEHAFAHVTEAGRSVGLDFRFDLIRVMPNTLLSHRVIALTPQEKKTALVEAIHRAVFEEGRDIGRLEELLALAEAEGVDASELRERLERGEGTAEVERDLAFAAKLKVSGVPFFIINRRFGVTGAQQPETLLQVLRRAAGESGKQA